MRNLWTKEEDSDLIIAKSSGLTYKEIQEKYLPNRTVGSVRVRGSYLVSQGLVESSKKSTNISWTDEDLEDLIRLRVKGLKHKEIASILGRTETAISNKISFINKFAKDTIILQKNIKRAIIAYPTKNKYLGRYYYKQDIPSMDKIIQLYGSWEKAKNLILKESMILDKTPTILYYIKILKEDKIFYKIGITSKSVGERFRKEAGINIEILKERKFNTVKEARKEELTILKTFDKYRIPQFEKVLEYGGNTEIFYTDILRLDNFSS